VRGLSPHSFHSPRARRPTFVAASSAKRYNGRHASKCKPALNTLADKTNLAKIILQYPRSAWVGRSVSPTRESRRLENRFEDYHGRGESCRKTTIHPGKELADAIGAFGITVDPDAAGENWVLGRPRWRCALFISPSTSRSRGRHPRPAIEASVSGTL
jgi:hypothetical protein